MTPDIIEQSAQPYVGITRNVTMATINEVADRIPVLIGWLTSRDIAIAGAPFLRYLAIDMAGELIVEAGVPADTGGVDGDEEIHTGALPAGRYATVTHRGHPDQLVRVFSDLLAWGEERDIAWDVSADGKRWACRVERYLTNPAEEPDPANWVTVVAIKLA